ncbi:MAG: oligosaccharide flippase family protein [Acutalibacteraceae bacterium]|nr:oligosaccharide flippase family protein [Acutalibacteraceae bacterium]
MAKVNQLRAGVWLSYINLLIGNIIPFIYTPYMLSTLGQAEYGLYSLANSVLGYIGLLNMGMGGTIVRYISKYRAEDDKKEEERVIGLFVVIFAVIAVVMLTAGLILANNLAIFYGESLTEAELITMRQLVILMTFNTAVFLPLSVFSSIIIAHEEYIFNKIISMLSTILAPTMNFVMLFLGFKSVGLVISTTILNSVMYIIYIVYSLKKLKIRPRFKKMPFGILKEIISFSFFVFLAQIVDTLYWTTDKLIIGSMLGTKMVAVYNIGATFNSYLTSASTTISGVLTPRVTIMVTKNSSSKELTELFIRTGRLQFIVVAFISSAFVVFGKQFIALWAGAGYEDAYFVALIVMLPLTIPLIQNLGLSILMAMNKHKFRSIIYAIIAVVNVILTLILTEHFGIIGAAFATCLAYVIGNIIIINWYYYNKIGLNIPLFWKNILKMSPVVIFMVISGLIVTHFLHIDSLITFLIGAVIYTVVYFVLAYFIMMNNYEKDVFRKPVKKVIGMCAEKLHIKQRCE